MVKIEHDSRKIFFTSDLHFGHEGVLQFAGRPFATAQEMDEVLINNWNDTVPVDGLVFVLGDIGFCSAERITEIFNQLNGSKILLRGNHDVNFKDALLNQLFDAIHDLLYIRIRDCESAAYQYMVLCHYPMLDWQSSFRGSWQLFGHLHTRNIPEFKTVRTHLFATQYDVGVDNNAFRPVSFSQIKGILAGQTNDSSFLKTIYY